MEDAADEQKIARIRRAHHDRIPVVLREHRAQRDGARVFKYLVPNNFLARDLLYVLRLRLKMHDSDALFLFHGSRVVSANDALVAFDTARESDNLPLELRYSLENCFGACDVGRGPAHSNASSAASSVGWMPIINRWCSMVTMALPWM